MASWFRDHLFDEYRFDDGRKLNGIIYLHRITDARMSGISVRNLRMFKSLCGSESLKNVIIVTTRWDLIDEAEGGRREEELMSDPDFFQPLIDAGARTLRHDNTLRSAQSIMAHLLDNNPIALQIQVEISEGKRLEDTAAGSEIRALKAKHLAEVRNLRAELEKMKARLEGERVAREHMAAMEEKRRIAEELRRKESEAKAEQERKRQAKLDSLEADRKLKAAQDLARQQFEDQLARMKRQAELDKEEADRKLKAAQVRWRNLQGNSPRTS